MGFIVGRVPSDTEAFRLLTRCVASGLPHVGAFAIRGSAELWKRQPRAAQAVLELYLSATQYRPDESLPLEALLEVYDAANEQLAPAFRGLPNYARPKTAYYCFGLALDQLIARGYLAEPALTKIADDAIAEYLERRTKAGREEGKSDEGKQWYYTLARAQALLLRGWDGEQYIARVVAAAAYAADFVSNVLDEYIRLALGFVDIEDAVLTRWLSITNAVLHALASRASTWSRVPYSEQALVACLLLIRPGSGVILSADWKYANRLTDFINNWLVLFRSKAGAAPMLLAFLLRFQEQFDVRTLLKWIVEADAGLPDHSAWSHDEDGPTALAALLDNLCNRDCAAFRAEDVESHVVRLIEHLARKGITLAVDVRNRLRQPPPA